MLSFLNNIMKDLKYLNGDLRLRMFLNNFSPSTFQLFCGKSLENVN